MFQKSGLNTRYRNPAAALPSYFERALSPDFHSRLVVCCNAATKTIFTVDYCSISLPKQPRSGSIHITS